MLGATRSPSCAAGASSPLRSLWPRSPWAASPLQRRRGLFEGQRLCAGDRGGSVPEHGWAGGEGVWLSVRLSRAEGGVEVVAQLQAKFGRACLAC